MDKLGWKFYIFPVGLLLFVGFLGFSVYAIKGKTIEKHNCIKTDFYTYESNPVGWRAVYKCETSPVAKGILE